MFKTYNAYDPRYTINFNYLTVELQVVTCLFLAKDWFIALLEGVARFEHSLHGAHVLPGQYCTEPSRPLAHKDKVVWLLSGRQLAKCSEIILKLHPLYPYGI